MGDTVVGSRDLQARCLVASSAQPCLLELGPGRTFCAVPEVVGHVLVHAIIDLVIVSQVSPLLPRRDAPPLLHMAALWLELGLAQKSHLPHKGRPVPGSGSGACGQ